jgi:hypothetical protein
MSEVRNASQLTKEIKQTREQFGDVVEQLVAKTDIKRRVSEQTGQLKNVVADDSRRRLVALVAAGVFGLIAGTLLLRWLADR